MLIQLWQKTDFSVVHGIKVFNLIDMDAVRSSRNIDRDRFCNHYKSEHIPLNIYSYSPREVIRINVQLLCN